MASLTQWSWVWVGSRRWTGKTGSLQSMGLQRVRHDWATELNWSYGIRSDQVERECRWKKRTKDWALEDAYFQGSGRGENRRGPAAKRGAPKVGGIRLPMCLKFKEGTFSRRDSSTMSTALKKSTGTKRENWQLTDMVSITGDLDSCYKVCFTSVVWIKAPFQWVKKENESKTANIGNSL